MASLSRPQILAFNPMTPAEVAMIASVGDVICHPNVQDPAMVDPAVLAGADAAITNGVVGFSQAMFAACPRLRHLHCISSGQEQIDHAEARRLGIPVTSGAGANADTVADHALGLALALLRRIPHYDREVRAGIWERGPAKFRLSGRSVGVLGLGEIGARIARRAEAFNTRVAYTARTPKSGLPWTFHAKVADLAAAVDILFIACPGDDSTHHIVNAAVLAALGPGGVIVNTSRGSVIDTPALVAALTSGGIGGAALDVLEEEPVVPAWVATCENLVITPHAGGWSADSRQAMMDKAVACLAAGVADLPR